MVDINDKTKVEAMEHGYRIVQHGDNGSVRGIIDLTADEIGDLYRITRPTDKHKLTTGLVSILLNIHRTVREKGRNDIHINREVPEVCGAQAYHQLSNTSKLRFHALIAKVRDENGNHKKGHWLITGRGGKFLRGEIEVPSIAETQKNVVVGHSGDMVSMARLKLQPVEFEHREDVQHGPPPQFNEHGQARLI